MVDTEDEEITTEETGASGIDLKPLNPGDGGESMSPFSLGKLTKNAKILEVSTVLSAFTNADDNFSAIVSVLDGFESSLSGLDDSIKFLLNTRDIANQMIVTQLSTWYYDNDEILHTYSSLREALNANLDFQGKINYAADVELTGSVLNFQRRKLIIDLNGHTITCSRRGLLGVYFGADITIQNGTIYAPRISADTVAEYKFQVNRGKLLLKNVHLDFDGSKNESIWQYRVFNMSQQQNEMLDAVGRAEIEFDKDCVVRFHDCNHGECLVCSISPYSYVASTYTTLSKDPEFLAKYPTQLDYELAIQPTVTIDGDLRMTKSDGVEVTSWPGFIAGTGSDWLETVVNVEKHARIFAQEHGIYLGNNGIININGGYIVAGTGICMRSGKLNIPRDANPTIVGIAEPKEVEIQEGLSGWYDPYHTLKQGSDWGTNLRLGHAILLEGNGVSYGKHAVEADIQSGTFISYNNTAIGSYGIAQKGTAAQYRAQDAEGHDLTSTYGSDTVYFCKRPEHFADGMQISRREAQEEYDYFTGTNPDYKTALSSVEPQLNAVKFERGHKADLSTEDGLKAAVKDLLILLGDKEEDITL